MIQFYAAGHLTVFMAVLAKTYVLETHAASPTWLLSHNIKKQQKIVLLNIQKSYFHNQKLENFIDLS